MATHNHGHNHDKSSKNISIVFLLNALFVVIEVIGGLLTNSIAILSDALHDFGDCLSLGTAWMLQKKSKKGRNEKYTYGYKRFSLLGSIFLSGVLTISSIIVIYKSVGRLFSPQEVDAQGMLWLAIVGIVVNGAAALKVKTGSSMNEKAVFIHIMEDVLGWISVLVVSIVMMFVNLPILDPLLSIAISIWVLINALRNTRTTFSIMLQSAPSDIDLALLTKQINSIGGIVSIHDLHVWSIDGESHIMTLHVVTQSKNKGEIRSEIIEVAHQMHIVHTTIEFEEPNQACEMDCDTTNPFENND